MIKIRSIMTKDVVTISQDSSIIEAAKLIVSKSVSGLVIVDKNNPIAIISENDIIKGIISKRTKIRDVMSNDFMVISPMTTFSEINKYLREKRIKRFPVVENERLIVCNEMDE